MSALSRSIYSGLDMGIASNLHDAPRGRLAAFTSEEIIDRQAGFEITTHALACCPCGADHSAGLLAYKLYLAATAPASMAMPLSDQTACATGDGMQQATLIYGGGIAGSTLTTASISVGDTVLSQVDFAGDQDWFRVQLQAGVTYQFALSGYGLTPLVDPYLELMDAFGSQLAFNDDGGSGLNCLLRFTPTASGTFYLNAHHFGAGAGRDPLGLTPLTPVS